jgi:hypothetical protein
MAACLDPTPGVLQGLAYPLAPDFEGLASPLHTLLQRNLAGLGWAERVRWMQVTGVDYAVLFGDVESPALELRARQEGIGYEARLYRLHGELPPAFWPREVHVAASPVEALGAVQDLPSVSEGVVISKPVQHSADGVVEIERRSADRIELAIRGGGGVAVVRRAFHPLWRARVDGKVTGTQPADLVLLGVEVPAGEHRVVLDVDDRPEAAAGIVALLAVAGLLGLGIRPTR